jgi:formate hydrogenlyase subunit 3/multisubunit Na+/H+ antiporter MnhD subunit
VTNSYLSTLCSLINSFNIILSLLILIFTIIIFYLSQNNSSQFLIKDYSSFRFVKFMLIFELVVFFITNLLLFIIYFSFYKNNQYSIIFYDNSADLYCNYALSFTLFSYKCTLDLFGLIFSNLAFFVGLVSLLCLDTRFYYNNIKFIFVCNILVITIFFFTITTNFFIFFLMYELLLIPSFLFVYFISPGKQAIQASIYFVI